MDNSLKELVDFSSKSFEALKDLVDALDQYRSLDPNDSTNRLDDALMQLEFAIENAKKVLGYA